MTIRTLLNPLEDNSITVTSSKSVRTQVILRLTSRYPINLTNVRLYANTPVSNRYLSTTIL